MTLTSRQHRWIYLLALAMVAFGLPFSKPIVSIGEIILVINFLLEGRVQERISKFKRSPSIWFFASVYIVHLIALFWTTDYSYALVDINRKLPLLIFPIVIPLSQRLTRREFLWIAAVFSGAVILASLISTYQYIIHHNDPGFNFRTLSLFTSHIRFSLMVCLSYIILLNCAWNEEKKMWLRVVYSMLAVWMSVFVFILQSMSGIVIWFLCSYMLLFYTMFYLKNTFWRISGTTILWVTPIFVMFYVFIQIDAFYPDKQVDLRKLEMRSAEGHYYHHDSLNLSLENGHYINLYVSPLEMEREWNKVSDIPYSSGQDAKGQYVRSTLVRYMTSKGLRKDTEGFSQLNRADIEAVENGVANVRFLYGNAIDNRIYTVIWEFDKMMNESRVQGHSVTQRFEFWKTGWHIFRENPIVGVGTGDINEAFLQMYERLDSKLAPVYRLRSHNQYLNIAAALGLLGIVIFLVSITWPFVRLPQANSFLYIGFCIILYVSMLNEDTLETQVGATLYAFFNAFFLYSLSGLPRVASKTDS